MKQKPSSRRKRSSAKSVLRLPDLEHAKAAVLNSLNSVDAKRGYRHAIDEFVHWYCSEPRLAFNRIVVSSVSLPVSEKVRQHCGIARKASDAAIFVRKYDDVKFTAAAGNLPGSFADSPKQFQLLQQPRRDSTADVTHHDGLSP